jgi:hypothetical protein
MVTRLLPRVLCAATVLGSAATLAVAAVPPAAFAAGELVRTAGPVAGTASTPAWRVVRRIGPAGQTTSLTAVTATGPGDAWAVGCSDCLNGKLLVERFNGSSWRQAALPAAITDGVSAAAIGASSTRNVWIMGGRTSGSVAVRWNGKSWTSSSVPSWVVRSDRAGDVADVLAVFGRSSVWNFSLGATRNPALAARFDGHAWRKVSLPGEPEAVSALAVSDIWAAGPSRKTLGSAHPVNILMHWNGRSWSTVRLPGLKLSGPASGQISGLVALGPRSVWAGVPTGGTVSRLRGLLLHWNGKTWRRVSAPVGSFNFPSANAPIVQDGHGGLWMQANGASSPFPLFLYHYSNGRFTRQRLGINLNLDAFARIPRTRSVWAVGLGANAQDTALQAIIAKDGR